MNGLTSPTPSDETARSAAERIYLQWDAALGAKDLDAAMALYAEDAVLESPLVRHLLGVEEGVRVGRDVLRDFVRIVLERTPPLRRRHRSPLFTDGRLLMWEYPRQTPNGEQMDLVEVMEIAHGLIVRHCVYWSWRALKVLEDDQYRR